MNYTDGYRFGTNNCLSHIREAIEAAQTGKHLSKLKASCNPDISQIKESIYLAFLAEEHDTQMKPYENG